MSVSLRSEQNTGTRDVSDAHRFDEQRLLHYLSSHVENFRGPLSVSQFKGGQSNPTYLLRAESGRYVLRRKPPGKLLKSAHAVDREFRIISALHAIGFPVPRPLVLCDDDAVIGTTFFVMEFVTGRLFWDLDLPGLDEETYIGQYCQRTGRAQGTAHRNFYSAFNFFRLAAILQGIAGRVRDAIAARAHAAQAVKAVEPLATLGWRYAETG